MGHYLPIVGMRKLQFFNFSILQFFSGLLVGMRSPLTGTSGPLRTGNYSALGQR
jgi:hypothetical protein